MQRDDKPKKPDEVESGQLENDNDKQPPKKPNKWGFNLNLKQHEETLQKHRDQVAKQTTGQKEYKDVPPMIKRGF